jgi:Fur family ferric uptake transcriptional regulator
MCHRCDYETLLEENGLNAGRNRMRVLEVIGDNEGPINATEIHRRLIRSDPINRVTVYRILDLLVENGIVERISGEGRSFYYGLAANENHRPHPHFYCRRCGGVQCLSPGSLTVDSEPLLQTFSGRVETVAVRVVGICAHCTTSVQGKIS